MAVSLRPVPDGESAGCVRLQWIVLRAVCLLPHFACHTHCPSHHLPPFSLLCPRPVLAPFICFKFACPQSIHFCFAPVPFPCAPGSVRASSLSPCHTNKFASCKTVPLAAEKRACSGGPCTGSILTGYSFPAEFMILGHGLM